MNSAHNDIISSTGIQFFGKITASISHEAKNALAIINENAGLLEDFTIMAEKGVPLDPVRLKSLAGTIAKQISRSNEIFKNMNRFAHSADKTISLEDLREITELVVTVSTRLAAMKNKSLSCKNPETPLKITTYPFLLETLLFLCLNFIMASIDKAKHIEFIAEKISTGARIRLRADGKFAESSKADFPAERERALIELLKGEIALSPEEIIINLPNNIEN